MRAVHRLICIATLVPLGSATLASAAAELPGGAPAAAPPANLLRAQIAVRFDPQRQCPELRVADPEEQSVSVVVFFVGPTGVPSQAAVRTAARADGLDSASTDCVLRLRFQPAIRWGDGAPIESWQQIAWKWAPARLRQGAAAATTTHGEPGSLTAAPAAGVAVRVCVDREGKLVHDPTIVSSSGDAGFDAAAVQIARSGSGSYRPTSTTTGQPASECLELSIKPAGK